MEPESERYVIYVISRIHLSIFSPLQIYMSAQSVHIGKSTPNMVVSVISASASLLTEPIT